MIWFRIIIKLSDVNHYDFNPNVVGGTKCVPLICDNTLPAHALALLCYKFPQGAIKVVCSFC